LIAYLAPRMLGMKMSNWVPLGDVFSGSANETANRLGTDGLQKIAHNFVTSSINSSSTSNTAMLRLQHPPKMVAANVTVAAAAVAAAVWSAVVALHSCWLSVHALPSLGLLRTGVHGAESLWFPSQLLHGWRLQVAQRVARRTWNVDPQLSAAPAPPLQIPHAPRRGQIAGR